jgi:hypothetical protein
MKPDLEWRKWQIGMLLDEIEKTEAAIALPELEEFQDYDREEALEIIERIEAAILARWAERKIA